MSGGPILVAASVGIDRVWLLGEALRPGGRIALLDRRCRIGGAGANASAAVAALGCRPLVLTPLARDATGDAMLAALAGAGVDVSLVQRFDGATRVGDILLGADGERTLVTRGGGAPRPLPAPLLEQPFSIALVNLARLADPAQLHAVAARGLVVAQMPLDPAESRPAHILLASRSDVGRTGVEALWRRRRELDGRALTRLVITDGAAGIEVASAEGLRRFPPGPAVVADSIGAGDFFAAGLLAALHAGRPFEAAVPEAQAAAARFLAARPLPVDAWLPEPIAAALG